MYPIRSPWPIKLKQNKTHTWTLNIALFKDSLVKEEIKKEVKDFLEFNEMRTRSYQYFWVQ